MMLRMVTRASLALSVATASLAVSCVGTELQAPAGHPANPTAQAVALPQPTALTPELDVSSEAHDEHEHTRHPHQHPIEAPSSVPTEASRKQQSEAPAARYTCPMHPEIVRHEPGECPICGMKLVPKKDQK